MPRKVKAQITGQNRKMAKCPVICAYRATGVAPAARRHTHRPVTTPAGTLLRLPTRRPLAFL